MNAIYRIENLFKSYGSKRVLVDLSFEVRRGESLIILGGSGSGKSVALRQLNGLEKPVQYRLREYCPENQTARNANVTPCSHLSKSINVTLEISGQSQNAGIRVPARTLSKTKAPANCQRL